MTNAGESARANLTSASITGRTRPVTARVPSTNGGSRWSLTRETCMPSITTAKKCCCWAPWFPWTQIRLPQSASTPGGLTTRRTTRRCIVPPTAYWRVGPGEKVWAGHCTGRGADRRAAGSGVMAVASLAPLRMADLQHLAIPGQNKVPLKGLRFSRFEHASPLMLWEWEAARRRTGSCGRAACSWTGGRCCCASWTPKVQRCEVHPICEGRRNAYLRRVAMSRLFSWRRKDGYFANRARLWN